jgi:hypothetical protein
VQNTVRRPKFVVTDDGKGIVSHAGAVLLTETAGVTGLKSGLSQGLERWRLPRSVHDPGKVVADLAVAVALGGDCLADAGVLRAEPALFGPVASDPVISRLIARLAADAPAALTAIGKARAGPRARAWELAWKSAPGACGELIVMDIDATLVTAHSDKEQAAPTWKKGWGFHPLTVFADHGAEGNGEPLAIMLRPGNAGSNTAADHIQVVKLALAQLPPEQQRRVLVRADSGGGTHEFLAWLSAPRRRMQYSVGFTITGDVQQAIAKVPARAWTPAYDSDGKVRDGAWVAELTGLLDLPSWPKGMRVIARKERPHPGAQLRFTDVEGHRVTCFATSARTGQLADLELRHRQRAQCEDRIRCAKDTGLRNLPLHGYAQNQIWCQIVALACELIAWTQLLALTGPAGGNQNGCGCACSPPPGASSAADGGNACAWHRDGRGPGRSPPPSSSSGTWHPVDQTHSPGDQEGETQGPVEPRPPGATAGHSATFQR